MFLRFSHVAVCTRASLLFMNESLLYGYGTIRLSTDSPGGYLGYLSCDLNPGILAQPHAHTVSACRAPSPELGAEEELLLGSTPRRDWWPGGSELFWDGEGSLGDLLETASPGSQSFTALGTLCLRGASPCTRESSRCLQRLGPSRTALAGAQARASLSTSVILCSSY